MFFVCKIVRNVYLRWAIPTTLLIFNALRWRNCLSLRAVENAFMSCCICGTVIITRVHADSIGSACKLHCKLCTDVDGVSCDGHSVDGKTETSQHFRAQGIYSELQ